MPKANTSKPNSIVKSTAISWLLHSIKILLGDKSIRRYIIVKYFPNLKYNSDKYIKTFDAFVKKGKKRQDKYKEIEKYLTSIEKLKKDIIVFTATNVQQDENDNETHFQSFIVDNKKKTLYIIDPAYDKTDDNFMGIYYAEISHELIKPFFENKGYTIHFVQLSKPAQTTTDDVFCQTWSLLILLQVLNNNDYEENKEYKMPSKQIDKYDIILEFYKKIFTNMPELIGNLDSEYTGTINDLNIEEKGKKQLLAYKPFDLLISMTKNDMVYAEDDE
jgi:hypothetical protein